MYHLIKKYVSQNLKSKAGSRGIDSKIHEASASSVSGAVTGYLPVKQA